MEISARRKVKIRLWLKRLPRRLLLILSLVFVTIITTDYLANLPRERHSGGYWYIERVLLGLQTAFKMTKGRLEAHHEDMKNTELLVSEIYIRGKRLDRLVEALPNSDVPLEKAKVRIGERTYKNARVRFRGDSINHWAFPNRSWRVQLADGDFYRVMQEFNLNVPRVESQLSNWLGYQLAKEIGGVIAPHAENVHFRLNRLFDGVRLLLEQPNQDMLIRRYFPPGKIFVGDIDTDQIYGTRPIQDIYFDASAWRVRAPGNDTSNEEMATLIEILDRQTAPKEFYQSLSTIVDLDALLKYMALLEIVGSMHVTDAHNGKFYFHPHLGHFIPIAWDTIPYMYLDTYEFDLGPNRLFRKVILNPLLRELKDREIWKAIHGFAKEEKIIEKVSNEVSRLRRDIYASPFKIHASADGIRHLSNREFEAAITRLKQTIRKRHSRLRERLSTEEISTTLSPVADTPGKHLLRCTVRSPAGIFITAITVSGNRSQERPLRLYRKEKTGELTRISQAETVKQGAFRFSIDEALYSEREYKQEYMADVTSAEYEYIFTDLPESFSMELHGRNSVTGDEVQLTVQK